MSQRKAARRCGRLGGIMFAAILPAMFMPAAMLALGIAGPALAQEKKIKIGVIFDLTGPLAGGGSELQYTGVKIMLCLLYTSPSPRDS